MDGRCNSGSLIRSFSPCCISLRLLIESLPVTEIAYGFLQTNVALDVLKKGGVSAAIFAPGWVYETNQPPDFETAQNRYSIFDISLCISE